VWPVATGTVAACSCLPGAVVVAICHYMIISHVDNICHVCVKVN